MKLVASNLLAQGYLDAENGIVVDDGYINFSSSERSSVTTTRCCDTTTAPSICSSQSLSSISEGDLLLDDTSYNYDSTKEAEEGEDTSGRDQQLIDEADVHAKNDRIMAAARLLRKVNNQRLLQKQHLKLLKKGSDIDYMLLNHLPNPEEGGWKIQFESHNAKQDVISYYRLDENNKMTARVEAIVPESLVVLVATILYEVELWHTWMPSFTFPAKMGFGKIAVLQNIGRAVQIMEANLDLPWPIASRVAYAEMTLADLVDDDGMFVAIVRSVSSDDFALPEKKEGIEQIDFDLGLVATKCPENYPGLLKSKQKKKYNENMILLTANASISPSVNIFTRTFFGPMVISFLRLAGRVRDGKLNQYDNVMEKYGWLKDCLANLLSK